MIGKWIDGLTDEQRDRIIEATEWRECCGYMLNDQPVCVLSHAYDVQEFVHICTRIPHELYPVGDRFDRLCIRRGLDRIVRACKMRAARRNVVVLPDMVRQVTR
jgi:hypothetical protein